MSASKKKLKKIPILPGQNRFHIIPRCRGGSNSTKNVFAIDEEIHDDYHKLFKNRTPDEVIVYLVEFFWRGKWEFVLDSLD